MNPELTREKRCVRTRTMEVYRHRRWLQAYLFRAKLALHAPLPPFWKSWTLMEATGALSPICPEMLIEDAWKERRQSKLRYRDAEKVRQRMELLLLTDTVPEYDEATRQKLFLRACAGDLQAARWIAPDDPLPEIPDYLKPRQSGLTPPQ